MKKTQKKCMFNQCLYTMIQISPDLHKLFPALTSIICNYIYPIEAAYLSELITYQIWLTETSISTNGNFALCGQRVCFPSCVVCSPPFPFLSYTREQVYLNPEKWGTAHSLTYRGISNNQQDFICGLILACS